MNKAVKKLRKLKDQLDLLEIRKDKILADMDDALDALEEDEDELLN